VGFSPSGPVKANRGIRARVPAAGKVLEGDDQRTLSPLYYDGAIVDGKTLHFLKPTPCKSSESLRPRGRVWLGLLSNWILDFKIKTAL